MRIFLLFILFMLSTSCIFGVEGEDIEEFRRKLAETKEKFEAMEDKLKEVSLREKKIRKAVKQLKREMRERRRKFRGWSKKLQKAEEEFSITLKKIKSSEERIKRYKVLLKHLLLSFYKLSNLKQKAFTPYDFPPPQYINLVAKRSIYLITNEKRMLDENLSRRDILEKEMEKLERKKNALHRSYLKKRRQKVAKQRLLKKVRGERVIYERRVRELKKASQELQEIIERLEAERSGYKTVGFRKLKGCLPWPIKGGEIFQKFGKFIHPEYKVEVVNKGIDFLGEVGEPVYSVCKGKVVWVGKFKNYGNLIMIDHGDGYYTVYSYLSDVSIKNGAHVEKGTLLGRIGEENPFKKPLLHFEIRFKGEPLNPLLWFSQTN